MATIVDAYKSIGDLNTWFKIRSGDTFMLSDMPEIIPLRWTFFKESWEFIKPELMNKIPTYQNPDFLAQQIKDFSKFIESQRNSTKKINPFSDGIILNKFYTIFDNIEVESVNLTNEEERLISLKIDATEQFSKNDFLKIKRNITDYRDRYADTIGLSDDDYNHAFGKSSIPPQITATITDVNTLLTLQNAIKSTDFILANLFAVDAFVDPFALARQNANNPEINIGQYSSGRLVKLNYGEDLQGLATRFFGDPNKWIDIAIANGLKPPYIDEVGFRLLLLSNGNSNQVNLGPTDFSGSLNIDKFFVNQAVFLQSDTQVFPEQRVIVNIRQIPVSGEILIELDGDADLAKYKTTENASIRVYTPNTVNSAFFVLIPSNEPLSDSRKDETPWFLSKSAEDEKRAKVDLAIDENGEISFGTNGDLKLSFGLENAVQAIKLKLITELGSLRYHPTFGLINLLGNKNSDLESIKAQIVESLNSQVRADARFDRIESLDVRYLVDNAIQGAAAMAIIMSVRLAGGNRVVPISFTVNY